MIEQGVINIILDNVSQEETLRIREIIHNLIANGSLSIRNGRCIIHYDNDARVMKIDHEFIKWKRLPEKSEYDKIKYQPNLTKAGQK